MGTGMLGCIATVQAAMNTKPKTKTLGLSRMQWMTYHKSIALIVAALLPVRLGLRLSSQLSKKIPESLPGSTVEKWAGKLGHAAMYGFITVMPVSGVAMGYFGGKGLPFFGTVIPGAEKPNGAIAGAAFKVHKQAGLFFEYFTAMHVGAVGFHMMKGQAILARMGIGAIAK
eukprot:CAMPEP_0171841224 /NCGR_PEP_ID=MMETSP0992-20121227/14446_1 /TAXON_ID=483369 /ORGANISM="non described non described, Strain CCMP2098" /LENGTH=170 /DNA_ID=CAMNT_0012458187 /DNA_START=103 /DNA_END=615 /DNA_ORIENTATION=-